LPNTDSCTAYRYSRYDQDNIDIADMMS